MKNNCENCPMRARYDLNPKSFLGRLWRWHINFCPGWKDYMKSIDESTRERLIEKYRLKKNTREWTDEEGQEINVQILKAVNNSILNLYGTSDFNIYYIRLLPKGSKTNKKIIGKLFQYIRYQCRSWGLGESTKDRMYRCFGIGDNIKTSWSEYQCSSP